MPKVDYIDLIEDITNRFTYHSPTAGQPEKYGRIRDQAKDFAFSLAEICPSSRELSLALTHLQNAVMWANAAIALNPELPPR